MEGSWDGVTYLKGVYDVGAQMLVNELECLWVEGRESLADEVVPRVGSLANPMLGTMVLCDGAGDGIDYSGGDGCVVGGVCRGRYSFLRRGWQM